MFFMSRATALSRYKTSASMVYMPALIPEQVLQAGAAYVKVMLFTPGTMSMFMDLFSLYRLA